MRFIRNEENKEQQVLVEGKIKSIHTPNYTKSLSQITGVCLMFTKLKEKWQVYE